MYPPITRTKTIMLSLRKKPWIGAKNKSNTPNGPPGLSWPVVPPQLPVVPGIQEITITNAVIKNKMVIAVGNLKGNNWNFFFLIFPIIDLIPPFLKIYILEYYFI
ncbi:hypothetical protein [Spiroplasma endosymbiont of Virgichneumon dumeticola]|uniref:hypothetical protein n=1 Tax=Spiroplasma endosymbiont of Virgichneumon dumeticola TaxID=3139323 RepID=UPI0035C9314C